MTPSCRRSQDGAADAFRGHFRVEHIDGVITADPAVCARLPQIERDESRTTEHYDRARGNLDRHGVHFLTAYVAGV